MVQDKRSGAIANEYGHFCAKRVAMFLGTKLLSINSNEVYINRELVVIKCAKEKTPEIGVSLKMLERIQYIIAALEEDHGGYVLYRVELQWYRKKNKTSRSKSPSAMKIMVVSCSSIRKECEKIGKMDVL